MDLCVTTAGFAHAGTCPTSHLFCSFSSFCHLSVPLSTMLSYQITSPPGTAPCTCAVRCRRKGDKFPTAAACQERAESSWTQDGPIHRDPQWGLGLSPVGQDAGRAWAAHAQCILDVDQPAIKAVVLGDAGQLVAHGTVRLLPTRQECLAQLLAVRPLRDESAWGGMGAALLCVPAGSQHPTTPVLPSPSTGTPFLCAALVQHTGGMVTVWWLK